MEFTINEERYLEKNKEGYKWHSLYESQMTDEDFEEALEYFRSRVRLLEKDLEENDIDKVIEEESKKLDHEKEVKKEALKNFKKYWREQIELMKKNGEAEKRILQTFINDFDKAKELILKKKRSSLEQKRKAELIQLEDAKKNLKIYQDAKETKEASDK